MGLHSILHVGYCVSLSNGSGLPDQGSHAGLHHPVFLMRTNRATLLVPSLDNYIGSYVEESGTYDQTELSILVSLIKPDSVVVEVGANVGSYSVYIAARIGERGALYCFEPFRLIYQILTANVALNGLSNVVTVNSGVGDWPSREVNADAPNLNVPGNYGASSLLDRSSRTWIPASPGTETVKIEPLDARGLLRRIDLIKIDVEGMEFEVIRGGKDTISRDMPIVYAENHGPDSRTGLSFEETMQREFGYACIRPESLRLHDIVICESVHPLRSGIADP